jgi:hypothetical protein
MHFIPTYSSWLNQVERFFCYLFFHRLSRHHAHRHSSIRYVTPAQRHAGEDHQILAARHAVYLRAKEQNPARWSGATRNWNPIGPVTLNPERDSVIKTRLAGHNSQVLAA